MKKQSSPHAHRLLRLAVWFLLAAALLWNGWLLAVFAYPHSTWLHMEISELSIASQPWSWLFRTLYGLSAACMIGAAVSLLMAFQKTTSVWMTVGSALVLATGLLTFVDITHSLDCVQYRHPACIVRAQRELTSADGDLHQTESIITAYASMLLAMWIVILGVRFKQPVWLLCLAAALLVGIVLSLTTLAEDHKLATYAVTGRVWNLLVSSDLVVLAVLVCAILHTPQASSKRKASTS